MLAIELKARRGVEVSAETVRRWLAEINWVWKRAKLAGRDDDPLRDSKLAKIRFTIENLRKDAKLFFADELDIHLLPKVGYQWMEKGTQEEVITPGQNQKNYLAGALDLLTGKILHCLSSSKNHVLFLQLLKRLDTAYPIDSFKRIYVVVDNYRIHKAKAVISWLAEHPRFELLWLPTYCPKANPIERAFGDLHDCCTRNHKRTALLDLIQDVKDHLRFNGPWLYKIDDIYYDQAVTKEVHKLARQTNSIAA